jgi:hypothetical protein
VRVSLTSSGGLTDTVLTILGPNGDDLSFNDDAGTGTFSSLLFQAQASGRLFSTAGSYDGAEAGNRQMMVAPAAIPARVENRSVEF